MRTCLLALLFLSPALLAMSFEEIKEEIQACHTLLEVNPQDADTHYRLALAHYHDQQLDEAFAHFLLALDYVEKKEPRSLDSCREALDFYLSKGGGDPIAVASEMLRRYGDASSKEMRFVLSAAYANIGDYAHFFTHFYEGFPELWQTFLAYKTRGILSLRLVQHERDEQRRTAYREKAFACLTAALEHNFSDASLYKVLIFLAKDEKNDALVSSYLHTMVEHHVKVARADIYLYVREAVALEECEVAQKIIDQAREHYEYSRAVTAAQEYLNQHVN